MALQVQGKPKVNAEDIRYLQTLKNTDPEASEILTEYLAKTQKQVPGVVKGSLDIQQMMYGAR
jgi:hypothetical protein